MADDAVHRPYARLTPQQAERVQRECEVLAFEVEGLGWRLEDASESQDGTELVWVPKKPAQDAIDLVSMYTDDASRGGWEER
jgi:hypothetical protein